MGFAGKALPRAERRFTEGGGEVPGSLPVRAGAKGRQAGLVGNVAQLGAKRIRREKWKRE
jgi:hypothetical protein